MSTICAPMKSMDSACTYYKTNYICLCDSINEGLTTLLARYNLVNARFCHKERCGMFEPESPEMKSCTNCISASHAIRKDRIPFLFTEPSTVEDIVQSHAMIQNAIQNAAMTYHEIDAFADSLEAKKFATYLWVHGRPSIDFEHNSNSYIMSHCGECRVASFDPTKLELLLNPNTTMMSSPESYAKPVRRKTVI